MISRDRQLNLFMKIRSRLSSIRQSTLQNTSLRHLLQYTFKVGGIVAWIVLFLFVAGFFNRPVNSENSDSNDLLRFNGQDNSILKKVLKETDPKIHEPQIAKIKDITL